MLIFAILCLLHFVVIFVGNENPSRVITKLLPMFFLIYSAYKNISPKNSIKKFILAALAFSTFGDLFLAFETYFIPGLGSFLIAQITYSIGFSKQGKVNFLRAIPFYGIGGALFFYLASSLSSELLIPVAIYVIALTTMAWRASAREIPPQSLGKSAIGASLFLISDAIIALTQFKGLPIPYPSFFIMITYYAAQYLLVESNIES
jgi:uncharacterized membrane protein YhhN